jgi:glycosyltransferase involved in cell wall biosynthesis
MSLRILFATHSVRDPLTAVYSNICSRAEHLRRSGHMVDVLTPGDIGIRQMSGVWPLLFGLVLLRRGRLTSYDLVVFHSHCGWAFGAVRRWVRQRVTTVTVFHGLEPLYHMAEQQELGRQGRRYGFGFRVLHTVLLRWLTRFSCRGSDAVLCLNAAERDYLVQNGWSDPARTAIVRNGVESALYTPRGHNGRARTLLFVGQWLPRKGIRYLTRAFEGVAPRDPDLQLVCAGTGGTSDRVLADFEPAVRGRVRVYPRVDRAALGQLLREADVFVFPSLFEGASGALLEAMAASLAIVASDAGAARDILVHEGNALVVPCGDADALAAAIDRMVADGELRDRLARAAHELAQEYEWSRVNASYCALLLDAAGGQSVQPGTAVLSK